MTTSELKCPECGEAVWDLPSGHKLAKCWNSTGHANGGTIAFDTMDDDEPTARFTVIESTPGYLPDDDDPATFDSVEEAREYAVDRLDRLVDFIHEGQSLDEDSAGLRIIGDFADGDRSVIVYDDSRLHDLGRVIEIVESEEGL